MKDIEKSVLFIPITPAGTPLLHIGAKTETKAWANLLREAAHMPYKTIENFKIRGYTMGRSKQ